jgi:hypothetical protein
MAAHPFPAEQIQWREVDSSNVARIGWDSRNRLYVEFKHGGTYMYDGVSRQRAVAIARVKSVGRYISKSIVPNFEAVKIA